MAEDCLLNSVEGNAQDSEVAIRSETQRSSCVFCFVLLFCCLLLLITRKNHTGLWGSRCHFNAYIYVQWGDQHFCHLKHGTLAFAKAFQILLTQAPCCPCLPQSFVCSATSFHLVPLSFLPTSDCQVSVLCCFKANRCRHLGEKSMGLSGNWDTRGHHRSSQSLRVSQGSSGGRGQ